MTIAKLLSQHLMGREAGHRHSWRWPIRAELKPSRPPLGEVAVQYDKDVAQRKTTHATLGSAPRLATCAAGPEEHGDALSVCLKALTCVKTRGRIWGHSEVQARDISCLGEMLTMNKMPNQPVSELNDSRALSVPPELTRPKQSIVCGSQLGLPLLQTTIHSLSTQA